ncbi:phosphoadenosine phosphosulfate reductase family protein (plasmid) [Methanosphaera sp. ISO3-F5]|uniref:phosphoadenosine phosphosulfate reductase domain-containing protein n=1 Tax=Methanosphaera sp. ISO3-F5 TaxID=1452353 RepID=UPI002B2600CF|nr:phosphoadenosine phosphosulfate reductase family protein [Methanosphaera sp. ISO3-F5]WQH65337.1 phosphoadenosine phosphosulfate reductase family protein [Methanosphaera sp. ISO3-F5]
MYNVKWDEKINGILLTDEVTELPSPRPVYYEELDLLGFNEFWSYPKSEKPLLWSVGRKYFYKGFPVASTKGGNALKLPTLNIEDSFENLKIKEVNIEKVIKKNEDALFVLENDAIDFIENVCKKYDKYPLSVSFSGGKDSQVVLNLITRVIHSDNIDIIFSDTTLEHEYTYQTVERTIDCYKEKYPDLKFNKANPIKHSKLFFEDMGLPSRFHRWCTPVLKTAPYNNLINKLIGTNTKIVVFEGVRAEESPQRSKYKQIADGVKNPVIVNARPILYWNYTEVFLYNFYKNLPINPLYRYGLTRVGCELCPYSSEWSECITSHINPKFKEEYIPLIKEYAKNRGLFDEKDLNKFVSEGQWKKRAGGKGIISDSSINFTQTLKNFKSISIKPNENFLEWVKVLGNVNYYQKKDIIKGELYIDGIFVPFSLTKKDNKEIIEFYDILGDVKLQNKLKKILQKSTFCVHCGVCDVQCPENAIKTTSKLHIDSNTCIHCERCINFTRYGCYRAKSIDSGLGENRMNKKTTGIDKYSTFGLREEWLEEFFYFGDDWLENNNLGPKQVPALLNWLSEANLINRKTKKMTQLAKDLKIIYENEPLFVWTIIWINLYYNSKVVKWYCDTIDWGTKISKQDLLENIMQSFPNLSKGTLNNAISAMINMFDNSPLGETFNLGSLEKKGRAVKFINKDFITDELDMMAVAYSLFKISEYNSNYDLTVTELYDENFEGGPYKQFGISQKDFERILRGLKERKHNILKVDLVADLDNIFLNEDISTNDLIKFKRDDYYEI